MLGPMARLERQLSGELHAWLERRRADEQRFRALTAAVIGKRGEPAREQLARVLRESRPPGLARR